jgi:3-deoxy-D-manno-octulosonic-acid transferase
VTLRERLAGAAVTAATPLLPALGLVSRDLGRAAAERRGVVHRLRAWADAGRDPGRPLVWLHGASAGELVGAAAAVRELRARRDVQLMVSYFSPSAEGALPRLDPEVAEVLPLDTFREARRALQAVRPDAVVFAKGDLWPNFTRAAAHLGVPAGLVNGTVREGSSRLGPASRFLLRPAYGRLLRVGAASEEDAGRLRRLGVRPDALRVTGDGAFDQALARADGPGRTAGGPAARLRELAPGEGPLLVAGSSWREDEEAVLAAAAELARAGRPLRLALVPHQPDEAALRFLEEACRRHLGVAPVLWSRLDGSAASGPDDGSESTAAVGPGSEAGGWDGAADEGAVGLRPVVVDVTGVLAALYPAADVAWVGGGFGDEGLHSVVEPAAAGVPVLFGRGGSTRREARELVERGAGRSVPPHGVAGALAELLERPARRRQMGRAARAYVEEGAGAAGASADLVEELLDADGSG